MTRWIDPKPADLGPLKSLQLPALLGEMLVRRGIADPTAARTFLDPDSIPPERFPGIGEPVERVLRAVRDKERICIWGDFDVDGQTSTALLVQALQALGADVSYYVPVRGTEGHGVHIPSLKAIIDGGASLIVTCDTGITAHEAVNYGLSRGVTFIITDHHDVGETLPDAFAVVDPKLLPPTHSLSNLAGVGVAYKLAEALLDDREQVLRLLRDLVGLGLIADVAILRGETRALAQKGIAAIRTTDRLGLKVIAERSQTILSNVTEETIGFSLAPRLNAVGRLSDANAAVELLLTRDPIRAQVLAAQLEGLNTQRKLLTEQVFQAAQAQLSADPSLLRQPLLILMHPSWPGGVVGIVAARLVERYRKPAILFSSSEAGVLHGSARSIDGVDISRAIAGSREHLMGFGGHPMAAGLSLQAELLPQFRKSIERQVEQMLGAAQVEEDTVTIDRWFRLQDLSSELADQVELLAPFGAGNPIPLFAARHLHLKSSTMIGRAKEHRSLVVSDAVGNTQEVLWWNGGEEDLPTGEFDLAFSLRTSSFRGRSRLGLELQDFRLVGIQTIEVVSPKFEVVDLRAQGALAKLPPSCQIWAEGADAGKGVDRFHLVASDELAIWTAPPSRTDLRAALAAAHPRSVYLVCAPSSASQGPRDFLNILAGMAKFTLSQHEGRTKVSQMAVATAHRELTIRIGLEWLVAGGHVEVNLTEDDVQIGPGTLSSNPPLQSELYAGVTSLLDETAAYREHFSTANPGTLL